VKIPASLLAALCLPLALTAAGTDATWLDHLHLSATGTVSTVNNISRTSFAAARKDATTYELAVASTHARQLAPNLLLVATADANSLVLSDFTLNNHTRLGGRLALQRKFGLGPQATVLQFHAAANWKAARFADDRGWTSEGGVELAKRVLPNLRLAASATWLEHTARRDTFDLSQHGYAFDARWDIDEHWTLSGSAGWLTGDIVTNATWSTWGMMLGGMFGPAVYDYYTARPWTTTNLFGPGWVSYNVEADIDLWSVSLGYAVTDRTTVELRKSAAYIVNYAGISYPTDSWSLALSHRF
jgi:hypothetical protein